MHWQMIWLIVLTVGLAAHMVKDGMEFKKIRKLESEVAELKAKK